MQSYYGHDMEESSSASLAASSRQTPVRDAPSTTLPLSLTRAPVPGSLTSASLAVPRAYSRKGRSSATWTTSSGDPDTLSDADELEDRDLFVEEYNRLAKKVGSLGLRGEWRPGLANGPDSTVFVCCCPKTIKRLVYVF